jgi:uncharacterized membrane protein
MKRIATWFVQGLLFVGPISLTIWVCYTAFNAIDNIVPANIPGVGFLVTIIVITFTGFVVSDLLTKRLVAMVDQTLNKLPLVRLIYSSIKDLLNAFVGEKKRFDRPVLVRPFRDSEARFLGFLTRESLALLNLPGHAAVYLPQSYNFAGNLIVVPHDLVQPVDLDSASAMAFIISAGISDSAAQTRSI